MYIRDLIVKNVKLLSDAHLPFVRNNDDVRMWTVLVGENGLCKTTLLQAIAAAASGRDRANQLANIPSLPDRRTAGAATIIAEFTFGEIGHTTRIYPYLEDHRPETPPYLFSQLSIEPEHRVFSGRSRFIEPRGHMDSLLEARAKGLSQWFVSGYGVDRRLPEPGNAPKLDDPEYQRLASLFDKGPIIGTGFADLFRDAKGDEFARAYARSLRHALLDQEHLLPRIKALELRGQGGAKGSQDLVEGHRFSFEAGAKAVKIPATWLSQGYQATIAWIADLIGQQFWDADYAVALNEMEGLVLIDELDLYLHPTWQVGLVRAIKATFPRMQFVVTTHSPMVLPGLERDEICAVSQDQHGNVRVDPSDQSPAVLTGSELYRIFFGINRLYPTEMGEALRKYGYLSADPFRTDAQQHEMEQIQQQLGTAGLLPDWEPVARRPGP